MTNSVKVFFDRRATTFAIPGKTVEVFAQNDSLRSTGRQPESLTQSAVTLAEASFQRRRRLTIDNQ
jgi:hypothetical protein